MKNYAHEMLWKLAGGEILGFVLFAKIAKLPFIQILYKRKP